MENVFQKSGLDWTIVRPPRLTDKPRSGKYRVLEGHLPRFGFTISRADVADFMVKAGENGAPDKESDGSVQLARFLHHVRICAKKIYGLRGTGLRARIFACRSAKIALALVVSASST